MLAEPPDHRAMVVHEPARPGRRSEVRRGRDLVRHATALRRLLGSHPRPERWDRPSFARQVETARRHLAPFRSRVALAASFERESFLPGLAGVTPDTALGRSPEVVAYAIRWLELGEGEPRPAWLAIPLADPIERRGLL